VFPIETRGEEKRGENSGDRSTQMARLLGPTGEFFRRRDEWRRHPMTINNFRRATPGLGIALVAFGVYLAGEAAYNHFNAPKPHDAAGAQHH
jgi:NADH-ubiquinone oxidoreductase B12 subunit family